MFIARFYTVVQAVNSCTVRLLEFTKIVLGIKYENKCDYITHIQKVKLLRFNQIRYFINMLGPTPF